MTAEALADKFNAKGRKWPRRAVCPVHQRQGQRYSSLTLAIYADEDRSRLWCPSGCKADDILAAVGLTWKDTLYTQRGSLSPEEYKAQRRKQELRAAKESLERQLGLVIMLRATEKGKQAYWAAAEKRIRQELFCVRWELEREKVEDEIMQRWDWKQAAINYGRKAV